MALTYPGVVKARIVLLVAFLMAFFYAWPRDADGSLMHPEEVARWLENRSLHEPPRGRTELWALAVLPVFVSLAVALSR